jgi:hypothetical protein
VNPYIKSWWSALAQQGDGVIVMGTYFFALGKLMG